MPGGGIVGSPDKGADNNVFEDRHSREGAHDLKGASDALPAYLVWPQPHEAFTGKADIAALRRQKTVDDIEECCLAGAVRADDAVKPARRHAQIDTVERPQPAKRDAHIAQHE